MRQALLLWIAAVVLLSLLPLRFKLLLGTTGAGHTWGHFVIFAITMLIAAWTAEARISQLVRACFVVLFGVLVEGSEVLAYHNSFEWQDVLIDTLGVVTGLLVLEARQQLARRPNPE